MLAVQIMMTYPAEFMRSWVNENDLNGKAILSEPPPAFGFQGRRSCAADALQCNERLVEMNGSLEDGVLE